MNIMPTDADKALRKKIRDLESKIKIISDSLKPKQERPNIKIKYDVQLKHSYINPVYTGKTVITDSTWNYVEIFLQKANSTESKEALMYWNQAKSFYEATLRLPILSAPLTTYYCFLNATKALLTFKKIGYNLKHGVTGKRIDGHYLLQNELITIKPLGVLSGLCNYFNEPVKNKEQAYSMRDIFYNLPFIHRAFQLTVDSTAYPVLFIPITKPRFVYDRFRKCGWFEAELPEKYSNQNSMSKIIGFGVDRKYSNLKSNRIRRNKVFVWDCKRNQPTEKSMKSFENYYFNIRRRLNYVYGVNNYWFIKRTEIAHTIDRNYLTLTYAAMHRLSELARYEPNALNKHLDKPHSWLLTEFINKSLVQFIDGIASEITGNDFKL